MLIQTTNLESTFKALRSRNPQYISSQNVPSHRDYKEIPNQNYPAGTSVHGAFGGNLTRFAASSTSAGGVVYGQPQFFSPVHTPINWQIPSKRLEQYQWARFFYENEPKIAASIDFYSYFPMNDYEHECRNKDVRVYFDKFKKRLELSKWTRLISHEVHLLGDCFPFQEVFCPVCGGSGRVGDELCEHEGGTVRRLVILNPDYVEVFSSPLNPDPVIALKPDEELISMVNGKVPGYNRLTPEVRALVSAGQPIRLDNRNVAHLKYGEGGYSRYGVGMVRRLFPVLSYKTKLMVAQWIVAERLIVPIKVVKVGSDERPAGPADIAAVQEQLAQTANDPNLTIVTHHNFDLEWYGACYDDQTEVLTENGWKSYGEVSKDHDERIATYNTENGKVEYQLPQEYHEYDYDGELCSFQSKHYDVMVTPNHKMLASERVWSSKDKKYDHDEWHAVRADNITENSRFISTSEWDGKIPEVSPWKGDKRLGNLSLDDYLKFVGYYISEGGLKSDNAVCITQQENSPCFSEIKEVMYKISSKVQESEDKRSDPSCWSFYINDSEFARTVAENYGGSSSSKRLPKWILGLPVRELGILLSALMEGDGDIRFSPSGNPRFRYSTVSRELADQVQEIAFKLGYSPKVKLESNDNENQKDVYRVYWSQRIKDYGYFSVKERNISRERYVGKVWCFTVPNGFFVTRRNGKVTIQGNSGKVLTLSNEFDFINQEILDGMMINNALLNGEGPTYNNAAIGIESMIERLESFRREMAQWIENHIYLPEAIRQGFVEENPETGEEEYIYPKVKWNSMHLRDQQQYRQSVLQLYEKGLLSAQTVLEVFDFDPDVEIERKRWDAVQMMAMTGGAGAGGMGGMGGGFGGMGGMEGGLGGIGGDMGGGMGDMGGGMEGGMGDMGGGMEGGATGAMAETDNIRQIRLAENQLNQVRNKLRVLKAKYYSEHPISNTMLVESELNRKKQRQVERTVEIWREATLSSADGKEASEYIKVAKQKSDRLLDKISEVNSLDDEGLVKEAQSMMSQVVNPSEYGGKVLKEKTRKKFDSEKKKVMKQRSGGEGEGMYSGQSRDEKGRIVFTKPEMQLLDGLHTYKKNGLIRYPIVPQFPVEYGGREYPIDFALPNLKIGVEADGEMFHSSEKQIISDKERDAKLAQLGWTILRFTDTEIEGSIERVLQTIVKTVMQKEMALNKQKEKMSKK